MESMGKKFRKLLKDEEYLFTGGVYSPLDAQIAERVGMKSIYLSGYSVAMANGWPDMGFLTMTEVTRISSMVQRSEEHTSELQSHSDLVCRLLLEKQKKNNKQLSDYE